MRAQAPEKGPPPQEVQHRAILGDLRGGDQHTQYHSGFAPVDDIVGLVAEPAASRPIHRAAVGVRLRGPQVRGPLSGATLEGAVLAPGPGIPIALGSVALPEDRKSVV